jgi:hypothetical protein
MGIEIPALVSCFVKYKKIRSVKISGIKLFKLSSIN